MGERMSGRVFEQFLEIEPYWLPHCHPGEGGGWVVSPECHHYFVKWLRLYGCDLLRVDGEWVVIDTTGHKN